MKKVFYGSIHLVLNIIVYIVAIFILYKAAIFAYDFSYEVFGNPVVVTSNQKPMTITLDSTTTVDDIGAVLAEKNMIKYKSAFALRMKLEELEEKIISGTYELTPPMDMDDFVKLITEKSAVEGTEEVTR